MEKSGKCTLISKNHYPVVPVVPLFDTHGKFLKVTILNRENTERNIKKLHLRKERFL